MKKLLSLICSSVLFTNLLLSNSIIKVNAEENVKEIQGTIKVITREAVGYKNQIKATEEKVPVIVMEGENYEIKNKTTNTLVLKNQSQDESKVVYDSVNYGTQNQIKSININKSSDIYVYPGEKVRISPKVGIIIDLSKEIYDNSQFLEDPLLKSIDIIEGKNFEFRNESDFPIPIPINYNEGQTLSTYDIVTYNGYNKVNSFYRFQNNSLNLGVNNRIRISLSKGDLIKLYIPYEYKDFLQEAQNPALYTFNAKTDESYELYGDAIENTIFKTSTSSSSSERFDLMKYDKNGFANRIVSDGYGDIPVSISEKVRLTQISGNNIDIYMPYEFNNNYKKVSMPALQEVTIPKYESYEFEGVEKENILTTNSSSTKGTLYDTVVFDENGNVTQTSKDIYQRFEIKKNGKNRITTSAGVELKVHIPYEYKDSYKKVDLPSVYTMEVLPNKYFEITNTYPITINTSSTASTGAGIVYDYVKYNNILDVESAGRGKTNTILLKQNDRLKLASTNNNYLKVYIPYDYKDMIKEVDTPVFTEFVLNGDRTYKINNNSDYKTVILSDASINGAKYNSSIITPGDYRPVVKKNTYGDISLKSKQSVDLSLSTTEPITFYLPYEISKSIYNYEDVNKDGNIDILDISTIAKDYNTFIGDKVYTAMCDLNYDGAVDIYDIILVSKSL